MRRKITNTTLVCIDCMKYGQAMQALQKSIEQCEFDRVLFLSDIEFNTSPEIESIKIARINSKEEYSTFIIKELYKYFDTDYVIICQWDGFILNGHVWDESFKEFDMVGACWLESDGFNCANGGFSLRSKKLMQILGTDETIVCTHPEDSVTGRIYRPYLEAKHGIKFAPDEVCDKFAYELREPNQHTLGFHSFFHEAYKETIVLKRSGALGDIITMEPVMRVLHNKGYRVVLDVPAHLFDVFTNHDYPVKHISQFDAGRIPAKYIDLDMAYEVKPKQLHLQSYFEVCGISGVEPTNPRLFNGQNMKKLFNKYVVIHIDERETKPRNIEGVDWVQVVDLLENYGYTVLQIGNQHHEVIATEINTPTVAFLKWVIAGADLFIGIDSGPAQIAVACGVKSIVMFGSVNPLYIYSACEHLYAIHNHKCCETPFCWHISPGTSGQECVVNKELPPCTVFDTSRLLHLINNIEL